MQTLKYDIRETIIIVAREEFIKKGFKDASMRNIATKSGVGLSNIYNYFRNKDVIFSQVLSGLLADLKHLMNEHNHNESIDLYVLNTDAYIKSQMELFSNIVRNHKEELYILLFKSAGSSLENFREQYTDQHTAIGIEYIKKAKEKYPYINTNISSFFIHTMSSWWMSIVGALVSHNLNDDELQQFISEYMAFGTAGWKKIMNIKG